MRRAVLILMSVVLIVLCSCELSMTAPKTGKVHILVYGNNYKNTTSPLYKTVNDAVQMGRALSKLSEKSNLIYYTTYIYGYDTSYDDIIDQTYSGNHDLYEIIHDVSEASLFNELDNLANETKEGDLTFIYLCGHGSSDIAGKTVAYGTDTSVKTNFVCCDYSNPLSPSLSYVRTSRILEAIDSIEGTKVVFSDFCYSGGLVQAGYVSVTGYEYSSMDAVQLFGYRDRISEDSSTFFLSAARYNEVSEEKAEKHGNFTKALLDAFGWDETNGTIHDIKAYSNGCITFYDVAKYTTNHDRAKQTPMYSGGSNDLVLFSF